MLATEIIAAKRDGKRLSAKQIAYFIDGYTKGIIPDYQASALTMAIYWQGMETEELLAWTNAMLHSGEVLDFSEIPGLKIDKHSTGGVGDKISLILAPLVAEAGVPVPMISGRGLGHTGGTLDKLESIPGFITQQNNKRFRELVRDLRCGLIGQTSNIAPADKKLYALRDATSTVESIPLIASSIMSKKLAEGIDGLVLDVKVGSGAFMKTIPQARELAKTMIAIGKGAGKKMSALITNMDQPLGRYIGNTLEVIESAEVLLGRGAKDLRELTLELAVEMVVMGGISKDRVEALPMLENLLDNGKAFRRFQRIIEAQGGDPTSIEDYGKLPTAKNKIDIYPTHSGYISSFMCENVGKSAMLLGAGRSRKEDIVDPAVGLVLHAKQGEKVGPNTPIATFHYNDDRALEEAKNLLLKSILIKEERTVLQPLIIERIE